MKMESHHFEFIKDSIVLSDTSERRERYRNGDFYNSDKVKDLNTRYRWDLLNECVECRWLCEQLYDYLNDDHIDTALRKIIAPL